MVIYLGGLLVRVLSVMAFSCDCVTLSFSLHRFAYNVKNLLFDPPHNSMHLQLSCRYMWSIAI